MLCKKCWYFLKIKFDLYYYLFVNTKHSILNIWILVFLGAQNRKLRLGSWDWRQFTWDKSLFLFVTGSFILWCWAMMFLSFRSCIKSSRGYFFFRFLDKYELENINEWKREKDPTRRIEPESVRVVDSSFVSPSAIPKVAYWSILSSYSSS